MEANKMTISEKTVEIVLVPNKVSSKGDLTSIYMNEEGKFFLLSDLEGYEEKDVKPYTMLFVTSDDMKELSPFLSKDGEIIDSTVMMIPKEGDKKIVASDDRSIFEYTDREVEGFSGHVPVPDIDQDFKRKWVDAANLGDRKRTVNIEGEYHSFYNGKHFDFEPAITIYNKIVIADDYGMVSKNNVRSMMEKFHQMHLNSSVGLNADRVIEKLIKEHL